LTIIVVVSWARLLVNGLVSTVEERVELADAWIDRGLSNPRLVGFDAGTQLRVVVTILMSISVDVKLETIVVGSSDSVTVLFPTKAVTVASVVDGVRRGPCLTVVVTI
jgi:hypothetical protein